VNARSQGIPSLGIILEAQCSFPSQYTDDVTGIRFQFEASGLYEANPIDIEPFGMDLIPEDPGLSVRFTLIAGPAIQYEFLRELEFL